jgi:2,4-diketo-3-deoxy-L-fuconate hydrolase
MKICRFDNNRIGIVVGDALSDVTPLFDRISKPSWPYPPYDWIVKHVPAMRAEIAAFLPQARVLSLKQMLLDSPVANPGKIIGAPINYRDHIQEANADKQIAHGRTFTTIDNLGLFLKANSALLGHGGRVIIPFPDRRTDHEVELAVVIGTPAKRVRREGALAYVFGYCVGLDMTVRGSEFAGFRKSADTFAVLGPWLTTAEEIANPNALDLKLSVNGQQRQCSNTRYLIFDVQRLIEYASAMYTLNPGDVIMTGTPAGVGPVRPGDVIDAHIEGLGCLSVTVTE